MRSAFPRDVTSCLIKNVYSESYDFYHCVEREMIREAALLADERFARSHVYAGVFYSYET